MNSNFYSCQQTDHMLDRIKYLISAEYIEKKITAPLDAVVVIFSNRKAFEYTHENFHTIIAEFIQTVSENTSLYGAKLTLEAAHREAVFLVNNFYNGLSFKGMDGALDDAVNPNYNMITLLLANLSAALKRYAQNKHFESVKYLYIDSADRQIKFAMTQRLLERELIILVPPMNTWSIQQLSGRLWELIQSNMRY